MFVFICVCVCVPVDLDHAVVLPEDLMVLSQGAILEATCNAVSSLKTHTVWYKVCVCVCVCVYLSLSNG